MRFQNQCLLVVILVCFVFSSHLLGEPFVIDKVLANLQGASQPSKLFFIPTAKVLNSMEISLSGGSSYGVEESSGLLARFGLGLGGVAEMEFSTQQVANQLTGDETRFPSRTFKVQIIPQRFTNHWFVPNLSAQLKTTSWGSVVENSSQISAAVDEAFRLNYMDKSLQSLQLSTRFTTMYVVAGKEFGIGGINLGASLTDVRTKEGGQWILDNNTWMHEYYRFPEIQKNIVKPFGGLFINANETTQVMAEVSALPNYKYNIEEKEIDITHAWIGIAGVRFFMFTWMSWDAGVRYISSFDGIADAEISVSMNMILPIKSNGSRFSNE
jgi:hypothetical protein